VTPKSSHPSSGTGTRVGDPAATLRFPYVGFLTERRRDTGSTEEVTGYVYNTRGELLSVDLPAGGTVERVEYTYDPLGRRIARRA